jgi:hypothetical protein
VPQTPPDEARALAQATAGDIAALSWAELDAYGKRDQQVVGESGRVFRVKSHVFWDMDEWASGIQINVKVYAPRGLRSVWPYKASATRGGPSDPVPTRPGVG